jgi:hypothetical protein
VSASDWMPIADAPRDGTLLQVLVPSAAGGFIEGAAYFDAVAYDGSWWWEGMKFGDYAADPISECNHGDPLYWRPMPVIDAAGEWLARRFYMERPAGGSDYLSWQEAQDQAEPYVSDLRYFAQLAVNVMRSVGKAA